MRKLRPLRRAAQAPGPVLSEVASEIAEMEQQLAFSTAFVERLLREGDHQAAVAVIDDQRRALAARVDAFEAGGAPRVRASRARRTAAAGLAAVFIIASGAVATLTQERDAPATYSGGSLTQVERDLEALTTGRLHLPTFSIQEIILSLETTVSMLQPDAGADASVRGRLRRIHHYLQNIAADSAEGAVRERAARVAGDIDRLLGDATVDPPADLERPRPPDPPRIRT